MLSLPQKSNRPHRFRNPISGLNIIIFNPGYMPHFYYLAFLCVYDVIILCFINTEMINQGDNGREFDAINLTEQLVKRKERLALTR